MARGADMSAPPVTELTQDVRFAVAMAVGFHYLVIVSELRRYG